MANLATINTDVFAILQDNMGEILPELIDAFVEDALLLLQQIRQGIVGSDQEVIATATHTLKSSAKNIGADRLAAYCDQLEDVLEATALADRTALLVLNQQADSEMQQVQLFLQSMAALMS